MGHRVVRRFCGPLLRGSTAAFAVTVALCVFGEPSRSAADDVTARYFQGLRDRRLFSMAERYCLEVLDDERAALPVRTEWTIELSKTFAEHAQYVVGVEHDDLWRRAAEVLESLEKREPNNPRRILLQAQGALVTAARAEFLAVLAEVAPEDAAAGRALAALEEAAVRLRESSKSLSSAAMKFRRAATDAPPVPLFEVRNLEDQVRLALAESLVTKAKLQPSDDAGRGTTLRDAEETARRGAAGAPNDPRTWRARVLLVECASLRGDRKQAAVQAAALEKDAPPQDVRDRLAAVQVRALLDERRPADAGTLLLKATRGRPNPPGELQHLKTLTLLALWRVADEKKDDALAGELTAEAEAQSKSVQENVGGWWGLRSQAAFDAVKEANLYGAEMGPAVRKAKGLWGAGKLDEAEKEYAKAAALAERGGHGDLAAELAFTRASIVLQSGDAGAAQQDFEAVVRKSPQSPKAAEAHLMAAYCLGKLYEKERTTESREAYVRRLEEHRTQYPDGPTFGEATWMLATLQERRLQYTQALPAYEAVPAAHRRAAEAQVAVARCYEVILDRLRELKRPADEWQSKAIAKLDEYLAGYPAAPETLDRRQAEVCLRAARLRLNATRPDYAEADALLERVTSSAGSQRGDGSDDAPGDTEREAWMGLHATASPLRVISLAAQRRWPQADALVRGLAKAQPADVLSVLEGLTQFAGTTDPEAEKGIGELQLRGIELLAERRDDLSAADRRRLDECHGAALVATNQPHKGVAIFEALLARSPKDLSLKRSLADALVRCNTPDELQKAKRMWRQMETAAKEGSADWMAARYQTARCALALDELDECRKLIAATRLLFPDMGGPELSARFDLMERSLKERIKRKAATGGGR